MATKPKDYLVTDATIYTVHHPVAVATKPNFGPDYAPIRSPWLSDANTAHPVAVARPEPSTIYTVHPAVIEHRFHTIEEVKPQSEGYSEGDAIAIVGIILAVLGLVLYLAGFHC